VGVAADHLPGDRLDHVGKGEFAFLLGHAGMEHDLQEQVAELVAQIVHVAALDGVGDLMRFLDRIGDDGRKILLDVPRAARFGIAQRGHDLDQPRNVLGRDHEKNLSGQGSPER
jgi:hypothetical protein